MHIILVPGLWLDGSSWDAVGALLGAAGHRTHPLTLPGMQSPEADRGDVRLADHVKAVVDSVDRCDPAEGRVMLVAHSAGAGVAHAAVDARPDRVARVVYVGGFPAADGETIVAEFPAEAGEIPLPEWDRFDSADLRDLDEDALRSFRLRAIPSPASLIRDRVSLSDHRRLQVPVTMICTEFSSQTLVEWMEEDPHPLPELAAIRHVEYVDLPTGHWPQFTRPSALAQLLVDRAYEPHQDEHGRIHPPSDAGETLTTLGFLEYQRATLAWKTGGLDAAGLSTGVAASSLTLGGLLKHLAGVEDYWFSYWLHGRPHSPPWDSVNWTSSQDWEFTSASDDSPEKLRGMWQQATTRSRALAAAAIAEGGLDRPAGRATKEGERPTLRWILQHMIEEYARHNGHADLLRESIDGETGE